MRPSARYSAATFGQIVEAVTIPWSDGEVGLALPFTAEKARRSSWS